MRFNTLLIANVVLAFLFGVGLIFMPSTLSDLYSAELTPAGAYMGQLLGACLVGFAILSWYARGISEFATRQAFATMFFLGYLLALILSVMAKANGILNDLGWVNIAIYALLAFGFGYCRFTKKT